MVKVKKSTSNKAKYLKISPWIAGAIIGFLAASLQTIASMTKPPAYGLCIACHSRDLINSIVNGVSGANLFIAPIIENPIFIPPLTIIGIMLGSFIASTVSKEFSITKVKNYSSLLKMFILGFLIMNFALILGACPIRAALRTAHGDIIALVGLLFIGVGAIVATLILERRVEV
jgi:hypothetical protein